MRFEVAERAREKRKPICCSSNAWRSLTSSKGDVKLVADGKGGFVERVNHENINRSRLRVDTRKWMAGKLAPKKYGDRILTEQQQLDAQGNPITPLFTVNVSPYPEPAAAPETASRAKDTRH